MYLHPSQATQEETTNSPGAAARAPCKKAEPRGFFSVRRTWLVDGFNLGFNHVLPKRLDITTISELDIRYTWDYII
jgi:hypothetical protein